MHDGFQHENPDYWRNFGNPWEIERPNIAYPIKFYGHVSTVDVENHQVFKWDSGEEVTAVAYDTPIPGGTRPTRSTCVCGPRNPRASSTSSPAKHRDHVQAILAKQRAETISAVLYPDDRTYQGKELRLKQQFFMVSATLQDIIRRYLVTHGDTFDEFPTKVALQLNDTHPTIGVPELMRLLMDEHGLGWTKAWDITTRVFSFTNHTVLPRSADDDFPRVLRGDAGEVPEQNERGDAAAVAGVLQPGAVGFDHRDVGHHGVGQGAGPPAGPAREGGRPGIPEALERYQAREQTKARGFGVREDRDACPPTRCSTSR